MFCYYNENDEQKAAWLRELIRENVIAPGEVDERSIKEVQAEDLKGFKQCHFFAGIGGWSYALRLAGWPDTQECWTGSCPCQSLSCAGQRKGHADQRHIWPSFYRLISEFHPSIVFGEQVASADGREWFSGVRADLEAAGYACGGADLCAAGVSAPMVSQRLYWLAASTRKQVGNGRQSWIQPGGVHPGMAKTDRYYRQWWSGPLQVGWNAIEAEVERSGRRYRAQWRIKPGLSLLAHGIPGRVAQLRGFGDAIVPQVAAEFIQAYSEALLEFS